MKFFSTNKCIPLALASFMAVGFTACSSVPSCDDSDVKDLLTRILKNNNLAPKNAKIKYSGFTTEFKDKDTKKVGCKAMANINGREDAIPYTAQYTDDGILYVEIGFYKIKFLKNF